jgi:NAD(P)-dependent dehydrogenase (short-subunit alcohol dehydrogenase family)
MSLVTVLAGRGPSGFGAHSTAAEVVAGLDLAGRTYLLTGCASGLGLETLRALGGRGGHVIAAARTVDKAAGALAATGAAGTPVACDLSEPASVRACVAAVRALGRPLDAILCNAGVMALARLEVKHGLELQLLTNHVGHFLLVTGLTEALAPAGRVVMTSSTAHKLAAREGIDFDNLDGARGYSKWRAYGRAKLANLLFARELARRFAGTARTANAVHPGVIRTNLGRHMNPVMRAALVVGNPLFLKSPAQGAATQTYVAVHPGASSANGLYFVSCHPAKPSRFALDDALAARLWRETEALAARLP